MTVQYSGSLLVWFVALLCSVDAFGNFQLPKVSFFGSASTLSGVESKKQQEQVILEAISSTNNGKTATVDEQINILQLVRGLETSFPVVIQSSLTEDPLVANLLNGTWYLQYTSPSNVSATTTGDDWTPVAAQEGASNIETRPFAARGTVSAAGVTVDTSNKPVQQIINVPDATVTNVVSFDPVNGVASTIVVSGTFRASSNSPSRAIVAFDTARIQALWGSDKRPIVTIDLGWIFDVLARIRNSRDNGWLETTYLSDTMRIGRGNKGTMFILTREPLAP